MRASDVRRENRERVLTSAGDVGVLDGKSTGWSSPIARDVSLQEMLLVRTGTGAKCSSAGRGGKAEKSGRLGDVGMKRFGGCGLEDRDNLFTSGGEKSGSAGKSRTDDGNAMAVSLSWASCIPLSSACVRSKGRCKTSIFNGLAAL